MSLKAAHLVFVTALSALCAGLAVWKLVDFFRPTGQGSDLALGLVGWLCAAGVVFYGRYFLKKLKSVGYL